jgi:hypothetical protein
MSDQVAYNVYLGRKLIDTVFGSAPRDNEDMRKSLVNHDGYDPSIRVVTPRRKMETEYEIQGNYGQGWECETTEIDFDEARKRLKEYRSNMPEYAHRILRRRVPISARS